MKNSIISKKSFITLFLFLVLTLTAFSGMQTMAASRKSAIKAYRRFLSKKTVTVKDNNESKKIKTKEFAVLKLNNDNIPELLVGSWTGYYLFSFKNGRVKQIGKDYIGGSALWSIGYYPGKSVLYEDGLAGVGSSAYYYKKVNIKRSRISDMAFRFQGMNFAEYYISQKKVGKATFDRFIAKKTGGVSMKTVKFYKNNKKNRQKKIR